MPVPSPFLLKKILAAEAALAAADSYPGQELKRLDAAVRQYAAELGEPRGLWDRSFADWRRDRDALASVVADLLASLQHHKDYDRDDGSTQDATVQRGLLILQSRYGIDREVLQQTAEHIYRQQKARGNEGSPGSIVYSVSDRTGPGKFVRRQVYTSAHEALLAFLTHDAPDGKMRIAMHDGESPTEPISAHYLLGVADQERQAYDVDERSTREREIQNAQSVWLHRRLISDPRYIPYPRIGVNADSIIRARDRWESAALEWFVMFRNFLPSEVVVTAPARGALDLPMPDDAQKVIAETILKASSGLSLAQGSSLMDEATDQLAAAWSALQPIAELGEGDAPSIAVAAQHLLNELTSRNPEAQFIRAVRYHTGRVEANMLARAHTAAQYRRFRGIHDLAPQELYRQVWNTALRSPDDVLLALGGMGMRDPEPPLGPDRFASQWQDTHPAAGQALELARRQSAEAEELARRASSGPHSGDRAFAHWVYCRTRVDAIMAVDAVLGRLAAHKQPEPEHEPSLVYREIRAHRQELTQMQDRAAVLAAFPTTQHARNYLIDRIRNLEEWINAHDGRLAQQADVDELQALERAVERLDQISPSPASQHTAKDEQPAETSLRRLGLRARRRLSAAPPAPAPQSLAQHTSLHHQQPSATSME
ncbi:hypothetical protein GCM10009578_065560 [Streptomyces rhizosphaericus]|nr:hypothetical protein [Streptomyces rhizosphaericus]